MNETGSTRHRGHGVRQAHPRPGGIRWSGARRSGGQSLHGAACHPVAPRPGVTMKDDLSPERWQRISALLDAALEIPVVERGAWLERACPDDAGLRAEVGALLAADRDAGSFLEEAAGARARTLSIGTPEESAPGSADGAGHEVGAWRLLRPLGEGGMGVVHLA